MLRNFIGWLVMLLMTGAANAASVKETKGNIYYVADDGKVHQLTSPGVDRSPQLSPDGKTVVFVRSKESGGDPEYSPDDICLVDTSGKNQRVVVKARPSSKPEDTLNALSKPAFSPDGKLIYFISAAWATSGAVHVLDLGTGKTRFITSGNTLKIVPSGKYAGDLIVSKHKYLAGGDTDDSYWLISPSGGEIMSLGNTEEKINEFLHTERP